MTRAAPMPLLLTLFLLITAPPAALGWQKGTPTTDPFSAYRAFIIARHPVGKDTAQHMAAMHPFLTEEGRAQIRGWGPAAQATLGRFFYAIPGLMDVTLARRTDKGERAVLEVVHLYDPMASGTSAKVRGQVEMLRTSGGWVVVSEALTPPADTPFYVNSLAETGWVCGGGTCRGLQGKGTFPEAVAMKARTEDEQRARDLKSGDGFAAGEIRAIIAAEAAYQAANGGFYGPVDCLVAPQGCIPSYPADGPRFLDVEIASTTIRRGYRRRFDAGAPAAKRPNVSPNSIQSFAVWMIPDPGRSGRTVCGDSRGVVCAIKAGPAPTTKGECPQDCEPISP